MSHLDDEALALLAIGEAPTDAERVHLEGCAACTGELAELQLTVAVARTTVDLGELETPPERVWEAIARDIGTPSSVTPPRAVPPTPPAEREAAGPSPSGRPTPTRPIRTFFTLAASVAVLLVLVGIGFAVRPTSPVELAAATLEAFPAHPGARGTATVLETGDSARVVRVTLDADADGGDGYREVWLINADATALVSLGTLEGQEGTFPIPADVEIDDYVLVDVSWEPVDGDPQHSGDSIVRGELRSA